MNHFRGDVGVHTTDGVSREGVPCLRDPPASSTRDLHGVIQGRSLMALTQAGALIEGHKESGDRASPHPVSYH
jgi:hypothetical protein